MYVCVLLDGKKEQIVLSVDGSFSLRPPAMPTEANGRVGVEKPEKTMGIYHQNCSWIPLAIEFIGRNRWLWNSMVQGTQKFRQVRTASCVIPYVMCGGLYYKCRCVSRVSLPALIYPGDRVTWKVLPEYSWSPSTTRSGSFLVLQLVLHLFG